MPRRIRASLVIAALSLAASSCGGVAGPSTTIALEELIPGRASEIADARATARAFIEAYARAGEDGSGSLAALIAGRELTTWARWLTVQNEQFAGAIRGTATVTSLQLTDILDRDGVRFASVDVLAEVRLDFSPEDDEPFSMVRSFDGPMTLARDAASGWLVVDATRDGTLMSDGIVVIEDGPVERGAVRLDVVAAFSFAPSVQFNIEVRNLGTGDLRLVEAASGVAGVDGFTEGIPTPALLRIRGGATVEGILAVPAASVLGGGELVLVYDDGSVRTEIRIDLAELLGTVTVTGEATPSPSV